MAVPISSISPSSLSCSTKVFGGLKPQNSIPFASAVPNLTAGFYEGVSKSLHWRYGSKPTRGRVNMMPIGTPIVPIRGPGQSMQLVDLWNALYRQNVIFISKYIDDDFGNQMLATMLFLDTIDDSKRIYLYISSPGGELTPSMALYDTMLSLRHPVGTICLGFAYNMSGFLLAAGDKGFRGAMPLALIGLQSPAGAARGQADDVRNEVDEILRIKNRLHRELAKHTGKTVEKIDEDLTGQLKRFSAPEALEYGLIDKIVKSSKIQHTQAQIDS